MSRRRLLGPLVLLLSVAGCTGSMPGSSAPTCDHPNALVLMAQSVPDASALPCIEAIPVGWGIGDMKMESGATRFSLRSDRAGAHAVDVRVLPACDVSDAVEIPSEVQGARRFELIEEVTGRYIETRYYVFDRGGCIEFRYNLPREGSALLLGEAAGAFSFKERQWLNAQLRKHTGLEL